MTIYSIIEKKRDGHALSGEEIAFFIQGVTNGTIADYQTAALLMAIFIRGMTPEETLALTMEMSRSGDSMPFDPTLVDKHSTGGCGDTTTLVLLPLCMAAGVKIAKTSGRSLGYTGGTIDKLESIPGFRTTLSPEEFSQNLSSLGAVLTSQTANIAPADKVLYSLRDVTATIDSLPLIAASIMSKKLATGTGRIVLDVKCGTGAFMKTEKDALALAWLMVDIGRRAGRDTRALLTRMDAPLGDAVGNALEVMEAIDVLRGKKGPLRDVVLALATQMTDQSISTLEALLDTGAPLGAFGRFVAAQGGDARVLSDFSLFKQPVYQRNISLSSEGFIQSMDASAIGTAALILGAGRSRKEDAIDFSAGIQMHKTVGDDASGPLCTLYTDKPDALDQAEMQIRQAIQLGMEKPPEKDIIIATVE